MTLIEGVGDEVTNFFIAVGIFLIVWIAWCSTNISEQPLIRTILILQQNTRNRVANFRSNQSTVLVNSSSELGSEENNQGTNNTDESGNSCPESPTNAGSSTEVSENREPATSGSAESSPESPEVPGTERPLTFILEERLIQAMDSNTDENPRTLLNQTNVSDSSNNSTEENSTEGQVDPKQSTPSEDDKISIKLKFMNDEQKMVTASLKEILGDFKRRNFQIELESRKLVRLVFKGQILQPDTQTLERCGLYNNCVVHCLVHQPRSNSPNTSQSSTENNSPLYFNPPNMPASAGLSAGQQDWDFSKVFFGVIVLVLGLAWYTRCYHAQLYNATSSILLSALTTIFVLSVLSHFFPDDEGLRNIE